MADTITVDEAYRMRDESAPIPASSFYENGVNKSAPIPAAALFDNGISRFATGGMALSAQALQDFVQKAAPFLEPERPGMLKRFAMGYTNDLSQGLGQLLASGERAPFSQADEQPIQPAPQFDVPPPQNLKESLTDVGSGLSAMVTTVGPLSAALKGTGMWGPLADALAFGADSKSKGGSFGEAALQGGVLGIISKIPAKTVLDSIMVKSLESATMGGTTEEFARARGETANPIDLTVNMAFPFAHAAGSKAVEAIKAKAAAKLKVAETGADVVEAIEGMRAEAVATMGKDGLLTPEGARAWAEQNKDAAAKLGAIEKPSGKDFMDAGVTGQRRPAGQADRWTQAERAEFARLLREPAPTKETASGKEENAAPQSAEQPVAAADGSEPVRKAGGPETSAEEAAFRAAQNEIPQSEVAAADVAIAHDALNDFVGKQRKLGLSMKSIEQSVEFRDLDTALRSAKGIETKAIEQETRAKAVAEPLSRENVKYKAMADLPPDVADAIRGQAQNLIAETRSKDVEATLRKIVEGKNDVGPKVEAQKERIVGQLLGELELDHHLRVPEPHPALEKALYGDASFDVTSLEQRQGIRVEGTADPVAEATSTSMKEPINGERQTQAQGRPEGLLTGKNEVAPADTAAPPSQIEVDIRQGKRVAPEILGKLTEAENAAKQRLMEKLGGGTLFSNLDPTIISDLAIIGAAKIAKGAINVASFTREMVAEFGEKIRPHIQVVWNASRKHLQSEARPDLANPISDRKARHIVDVVDYRRNQGGRPVVRTDAEVKARAAKLDYTKSKRKILKKAKAGELLGPEETVKAKEILNREGMKAMRSGKIIDAMQLVEAYREMGGEAARAFRLRADPVETPLQRGNRMLMESLLQPDNKTNKALEEAKSSGNNEAADRIRKDWEKKFQDLKKKLKVLGVDVDNIDKLIDPVKQARALGTVQAAKADVWDKAYEYWRNAILSSPLTHAANTVGNLGHGTWHFTAERFTEALVNTVARTKEGARLGELPHILAGVLPGLSRGAKNFLRTWKSESPFFEREIGGDKSKIENLTVAIEGKKGRVIRIPQRLLLAADEFSKTLFSEMDVGAQAYRIAKSEGLASKALSARMAELQYNTDSLAWMRALKNTHELTFQQESGKLAQKVIQARADLPGLRYLVPFITTPMNIFSTAISKSPLGALKLAEQVFKASRSGNWEGVSARAAQQVLAWGAVLALMDNDEKDPWITGAAPPGRNINPKVGSREMAMRAMPQQSIKIGDTWFSYARVEPFATVLAGTVDWLNALKSGDGERAALALPKSILGQLGDKTFLSGLGDVIEAVQSQNPSDIAKLVSKFTVSWVPNLVRTSGRALGDEKPERAVWGDGPDYVSRMMKRALQSTEIGVIDDQPDYDLWGRPVKNSESPFPKSDVLWRLMVPVYTRPDDVFVADRALVNWNNQHPEDEKFPESPAKYFKDPYTKKTVYMTDEQYATFSRRSGELAQKLLSGVKLNADKPTERDIVLIGRALEKGREAARRELFISIYRR